MSAITSILSSLLPGVFGVIDKIIPDVNKAAEIKAKLQEYLFNEGMEQLKSQTAVIIAEAQGGGWLQRNWRPLTMVSFVGLIWSYWLGYAPPNLSPETLADIFALIKIGLGGYVVGRSGEKIMQMYTQKGS